MKKLFFKITFIFVLLFGGMGFDAKAQQVPDTLQLEVKEIFDKAILDIARIASEAIIDSSIITEKTQAKEKIQYENWGKFSTSASNYPTIKNTVIISNSEVKIKGKDIKVDKEKLKLFVDNIFKNGNINFTLKEQFDKIIEEANNEANDKVEDAKTRKANFGKTPSPKDETILEQNREYILLGSLGLGIFNFILILILFFTKTRKLNSGNAVSLKDFEKLEKKFDDLNLLVHSPNSKIKNESTKENKPIIQSQKQETTVRKAEKPIEDYKNIQTIPTTINSQLPTEIKFAKKPSDSSNSFSQESLFSENDKDAIYKITIQGNQAIFVINSSNLVAMNKAMSSLSDFINTACESSNSANQGTTIQTRSEGILELKNNLWHITKKAKIEFV